MLMCESILRGFLSDILEARQLSSRKSVGATAVHLKLAVIPVTTIFRQFSDGLIRGPLLFGDELMRRVLLAPRFVANLAVKAVCA